MSMLDSSVKAKIVETTSIEANITIKEILHIMCNHWTKCLDNYYVIESEPELSVDNYSDSVTINLSGTDRVNLDHIIDDVNMLVEEDIEKLIRAKNIQHEKDVVKEVVEEGENGSL